MPHLSHTSLMGPLVNPFVPSHILSLLQEDAKQPSEKASSAVAANLRPFHIYDPADPISALSVPATNELQTRCKNSAEQSPSTQVTSSTSDSDATPATQRNVIVRNENVRKKKELVKDEAYWERRRKNNDAAKRSRDSRRQKEDEMALRAAVLEQENIRLRLEVEHLRAEVDRLRVLVLSPAILPASPAILPASRTVLHTPQSQPHQVTTSSAQSPPQQQQQASSAPGLFSPLTTRTAAEATQ